MNINEMLNIDGKKVEDKIEDAIDETRRELDGLMTDLTCKIYSQYMKKNLNKQHAIHKVVNTLEFGFPYEHHFNVVMENDKNFYVVDLTYNQFQNPEFLDLIFKGYEKLSDEEFAQYLRIVGKDKKDISFSSLFDQSIKRR